MCYVYSAQNLFDIGIKMLYSSGYSYSSAQLGIQWATPARVAERAALRNFPYSTNIASQSLSCSYARQDAIRAAALVFGLCVR
jgi:hypothetical protein